MKPNREKLQNKKLIKQEEIDYKMMTEFADNYEELSQKNAKFLEELSSKEAELRKSKFIKNVQDKNIKRL